MSTIGSYCKAYPSYKFRAFQDWKEPEERNFDDDEILFLQENYIVTENLYLDEGIIFDDVTFEWIEFCNHSLGFRGPASDAE